MSGSAIDRFGHLLGASPSMRAVYEQISRVAPTEATVLLVGESGTGKELVARTLHDMSSRCKMPFQAVNCGAISPQLIESEMFGHERGSFTGATREHKGHFENAHGGTLFLDEVTEMPVELQVKLLRVLETGRYMRVGSGREQEGNVRVIAATNRLPEEAVSEGKLREDLLYRLNVFPIWLPPLRERGGDIELLANAFLQQMNEVEGTNKYFSDAVMEHLRNHVWPGNARELRNVVQRAFIMADTMIDVASLPPEFGEVTESNGPQFTVSVGVSIADVERKLILATMEEYGGNKERVVETLGISLKTLYNRLHEYRDSAGAEPQA